MKTDQTTFKSKRWGTLQFQEDITRGCNPCEQCLLRMDVRECERAPCMRQERADGKAGYYTIIKDETQCI